MRFFDLPRFLQKLNQVSAENRSRVSLDARCKSLILINVSRETQVKNDEDKKTPGIKPGAKELENVSRET
ncbi:MAG: hypothetical protein IK091_00260 [Spirochaetales bacterium]|nr:hypothetical protein [Spirochaetales bacterium]